MNELDIQVFDVKQAEIDFNHEDIMKELDKTLKLYKGLVHTEETTPLLRKDIAKLRKLKTAANRFRIDQKDIMLQPITTFEDKVKEIIQKIDDVIDPLSEQEQEFEDKRRKDKLVHVENIRAKVYEEAELEDSEIPIEAISIETSYLTKSKTLIKVEEEMLQQAQDIKQSVSTKKANEEIITLTVESENSKHDINMSVSPYLSQLELYDVDSVKHTIIKDSKTEADKKEEAERIRVDKEKETERRKKEEEKIEAEQEAVNEVVEEVPSEVEEEKEVEYYYALSFQATKNEYNQVLDLLKSLNIKSMEL